MAPADLVSRIEKLLASIPMPLYAATTWDEVDARRAADVAASWERLAVQDWEDPEFIGAAIRIMTSLLDEAVDELSRGGAE
jgi:hypothetical protein